MEEEKQTKILIVDDEEANLKYMSTLISRYGYIFDTARNGIEAIEKTKKINPDIILLDILMPEMDGIEACKRLKEDPETRHIPIIVLTALEDKETKIESLKAGANDFLSKPVDNIELIARIKNFLQLKNLEEIKKNNEILTGTIKAIEIAKREWEQTMDCINDIVILIDARDNIIRCNKILTALTGRSYSELLNRKWQDVFKESGFSYKISSSGSIEYYHPGGRYFNYDIYYVKNLGTASTYTAVITLQDITDRKKREEERERTEEELKKSKEMLEAHHKELEKAYAELKAAQSQILQQEKMASIGQLAAGIAHEVNNPVGFIMSNLSSLQKYVSRLSEFIDVQTETIKKLSGDGKILNAITESRKSLKVDYIIDDLGNLIRESLDGAERVKKIVQDLKSFSRIDEAEWKMADINAGIESTINIVWNELKYKATVKKEYGDMPLTKCNPGQLNQVFMNILVNAAHAIEKQGEITMKTWHDNGYIYISISDTGCGIPADKIDRIFEPFFTTKEVGKGTGLGLSIAYDIVKKHNGDIIVESEVGKGTTFTVKVPVVEK
ncbi:MAG: response regulator [Nitrospirae bacterium]|nr:response regulator [Nitrospirota bacterium]